MMVQEDQMQLQGFMRLSEVLKIIPVSKATWWNGCRTGRFPKPYKLSLRVTAWKTSDIKRCIEGFASFSDK
ncbi:AlpA family phage regulatory protein [Spirosoma sp. RP8]|uniref:AlpA family phage regulatory protein n=1 Tax=Spirosoma liriopis TaxID=2937440 RepID=A0ABT0HHX4_9BACT|nr:AlpA family phage regulatory protein [Spirosoma liriopis]MCK8491764.1 AlpA family phage regulatory protein [Spirosoma liriopis]